MTKVGRRHTCSIHATTSCKRRCEGEENNAIKILPWYGVIVQPRNRRPTSLSLKQIKPYEQMMEDEIQKNGFTLIDSQWITRE